ncbi:DUF5683 domain-containing protein [Candidatus Symbiothrix dinenymphae]|uniref:DUF5683 domain-containing protein n=1 Tax=Candidatus Symbiothrix dinenymphae TaxID=467085 RepID=UPI0013156CA9|nr:DUF5683 domain-containing protein [Candidatus Symbiothrix dinenymphae]
MKRYVGALIGVFWVVSADIYSQETPLLQQDTVFVKHDSLTLGDSDIRTFDAGVKPFAKSKKSSFKPNPTTAVILSAVLPSAGQIYNGKYWKLPIVYGGILGCMYAINWNSTQKNNYQDAYTSFTQGNLADDAAWRAYKYYSYPDDPAEWTDQRRTSFTNSLRSKRNFYRRQWELSWIVTVAVYGVFMIDSYVDAKLFAFDVSDDLSINIQPTFFEKTVYNPATVGLHLSLNF